MERVHLIVDLAKCVGCYNCMVACKDEHVGNSWLPYTLPQEKHGGKWINPERHERGEHPFTEVCFVPKLCRHCGDAPCEKARPDAISRRRDGIVLLDAQKAKDDKSLTDACPYGIISWNEEYETAQKCTMCAHLLDSGWTEPRCVQACPLRALSIVRCDDAEFERIAEAQVLHPLDDSEAAPRVLYKNLHKYTDCFIAGALSYSAGGIEKAADGALVELYINGELLKEVKTDFFGEFKIDHIPKNSGTFELRFSFGSYKPLVKEVTVEGECVCLPVTAFE